MESVSEKVRIGHNRIVNRTVEGVAVSTLHYQSERTCSYTECDP